jgi:26S proteasome regulatory subunit N3
LPGCADIRVLVIKQNLQLLERAVSTSDPRFAYRVLKISNLRKRLSPELLVQVVRQVYPPDHPSVPVILSILDKVKGDHTPPPPPPFTSHPADQLMLQESSSMEVDTPAAPKSGKETRKIIPEGDAYIRMLVQLVLLDSNRLEEGALFSTALVEQIHSQNRRTLDQVGAKTLFYYSRFYELLGNLAATRPYSPLPLIHVQRF